MHMHRRATDPDVPKANPLEILGAWLRIWTPPRDVEIPPIPRRGVAAAVAGIVVIAALVLLVLSPAVDTGKQKDAERRAKQEAADTARRNAIARRDQAARTGGAPALAPAATVAARHELVGDVEQAITVDANKRFAAGTVDSRTKSTSC